MATSPNPKTAISPRRDEDFPEWYQQVVRVAELAEPSDVRGCMVIRPWGYGIWENMQRQLDAARADEAVLSMGAVRFIRYPHAPFRQRVWELRHNLTPYDAMYLALTEALGAAVLLTGDAGLAAEAARTIGPSRVRHVSA